jgi:predicted O-methyltransferase YrrM
MIAEHFPDSEVHGFDTFEGIPEDWHATRAGAYSTHGALPHAPANVVFHVGRFSETLPAFLAAHPGPIRFMNVDCDLYSSTKDVLDAVADRLRPGSVLVFDEYVMNPHWQQDEWRAWQEAVQRHGWRYRYIGISLASQQAVVQLV